MAQGDFSGGNWDYFVCVNYYNNLLAREEKMRYFWLLLVCASFAFGFGIGKTLSKTITETKEIENCDGVCYPKTFDLIKFCEGFYGEVGKKIIEEKNNALQENKENIWKYQQGYEEGFKEGKRKGNH